MRSTAPIDEVLQAATDRGDVPGIVAMAANRDGLLFKGAFGRRAQPLAASLGSKIVEPCNVLDIASVDNVFARIKQEWGKLDFVVHALAYSDPRELSGRYSNTTRENFVNSMVISCFSFTEIAKRAAEMMPDGGSLLTLSYGGATRAVPSYNVMGVAKAALEASVRYLAFDLGRDNIRVNALSAGPMRTLSGAGVSDARVIFNYQVDAGLCALFMGVVVLTLVFATLAALRARRSSTPTAMETPHVALYAIG